MTDLDNGAPTQHLVLLLLIPRLHVMVFTLSYPAESAALE
jgi:hypothetical protein